MSRRRPGAKGPAFPRPEAKRAAARLLRVHRQGLLDLGHDKEEKLAHILTFGYMTPPESRYVTALWRDFGAKVAEVEKVDDGRTPSLIVMDDALNASVGAPPTTR